MTDLQLQPCLGLCPFSLGQLAAIGLKDVTTGDTLCDPNHVITLERMEFPEPVISIAVEPKSQADQEKMGIALSKLAAEDPSFKVKTDDETGQTIISGMGEELSEEEIRSGLRKRTLNNEIVLATCGSAFKNKGVQAVLDSVIHYLPSPTEVKAITGVLDDKDETEAERHSSDDEPFSALAFKIATDPFVGTLTFFRCYSGVVNTGDTVYNPVKGKRERFGRIVQMHAKDREEIKEVRAGDIAAAIGLKC